MFVGVAGIIGAGKSTLTGPLAKELGGEAFHEPVETNPYLEDFYKDMGRWGFTMQLWLLARRFEQHQQVVWSGKTAVQDRTIYEDVVFARVLRADGYINKRDYENYESHFRLMLRYLMFPDVMLYLNVSPELAMSRVKERARGCEVAIPLEYLQKLHMEYARLMQDMQGHTRVVHLEWDRPVPAKIVANIVRQEIANNPMPFARHL